MASKRIKTIHDYKIDELFVKIFDEIKKNQLDVNFPYIEHQIEKVLHYPNYEKDFINKVRRLHNKENKSKEDNSVSQELFFQNTVLDYTLMVTSFNHDYPLTIPYAYQDVSNYRKKLQKEFKIIFDKEFMEFPLEDITIKKQKFDDEIPWDYDAYYNYSRVFQDFEGLYDCSPNQIWQKDFDISDESRGYKINLVDEICKYEDIILYPYDYKLIEGCKDDILIYSDIIRVIYWKYMNVERSNRPEDELIRPFYRNLKENLDKDSVWENLIDYASDYSNDVKEILPFTGRHEIDNMFQLLVMVVLFKRLKTIRDNFEEVLLRARNSFNNPKIGDSQFISYLIGFYQDICDSKERKLCISKGMKLNKPISDLYTKILIDFLAHKKIEYDGLLHEKYIINPNLSNIEFDDFIGSTKIPVRNKNYTYLDERKTYLLMLLLKDENIFLKEVNATLLQKATEVLTGYKEVQLRNKFGKTISKKITKNIDDTNLKSFQLKLQNLLRELKDL